MIGLLGAPGSGKSTVARMFESEHCEVIDADQLAREALDDHEIRDTLVAWWGSRVASGGQIDRKVIGEIVFADPKQRRRLEGLIHPYVNRRREELHGQILSDWPEPVFAIVEDCPLLLEAGLDGGCDYLVYIDCPLELRQQRVLESRGWSADVLAAREAAQWPLDTKRARADYTVSSVGDRLAIQAQVDSVLTDIRQSFARVRASGR
ncbi:dephospho-CoA kinase [Phycisphaeraceae bacterium D3-23]